MTEHEARKKNVTENDDHSPELDRIVIEYAGREQEIDPERYAFWQRDFLFAEANRKCVAVQLLKDLAVLPSERSRCLEVGFRNGGWISTFLPWGIRQENISGIELLEERADTARAIFPSADLRTGDAAALPLSHAAGNDTRASFDVSRIRRTVKLRGHTVGKMQGLGLYICFPKDATKRKRQFISTSE